MLKFLSRLLAGSGDAAPAATRSAGRPIPGPRTAAPPPQRFSRTARASDDAALAPLAVAWADALPDEARPAELLLRHPLVANRLAVCWRDQALAERVLDELLISGRDDRQGFSSHVATELLRLRDLRSRQEGTGEVRPGKWDTDAVAPSDRVASAAREAGGG